VRQRVRPAVSRLERQLVARVEVADLRDWSVERRLETRARRSIHRVVDDADDFEGVDLGPLEAGSNDKHFIMRDWRCFSSTDMVNWKSEGVPISLAHDVAQETAADAPNILKRTLAPVTPGGTVTHTIRVGGRQASFTVLSTSTAADSIPDAFAFTAQTNVPLSSVVTSNNITVQGITGYSSATVTNGTFSVGCSDGGFVTSSKRIANGDQVCVRHTSSAQNSTSASTTLSIGGVVATFSSTTVAAAVTPPPSGGASSGGGKSGGGGALDELLLGALGMCAALSLLSRNRRRITTASRHSQGRLNCLEGGRVE